MRAISVNINSTLVSLNSSLVGLNSTPVSLSIVNLRGLKLGYLLELEISSETLNMFKFSKVPHQRCLLQIYLTFLQL